MTSQRESGPPRIVRTKTTELAVTGPDSYRLSARLTDMSYDCDYGTDVSATGATNGTVHDFTLDGELAGADRVITALEVSAGTHPYQGCPLVLPRCQELVGQSLASGWRRTVLSLLGGAAGCTHVTTLLLGLAEVRAMAFFLRMNEHLPYTPENRQGGQWMAVGLEQAPRAIGACHVLTSDGPVVSRARQLAAPPDQDPAAGDPPG